MIEWHTTLDSTTHQNQVMQVYFFLYSNLGNVYSVGFFMSHQLTVVCHCANMATLVVEYWLEVVKQHVTGTFVVHYSSSTHIQCTHTHMHICTHVCTCGAAFTGTGNFCAANLC